MEEQFVPYKIALKLKELGFNEECLATIDQTEYLHIKGTKNSPRGAMVYNIIPAPLWQQVFDWFRGEHDLHGEIYKNYIHSNSTFNYGYSIPMLIDRGYDVADFDTYEEARLECLKKLIELVK